MADGPLTDELLDRRAAVAELGAELRALTDLITRTEALLGLWHVQAESLRKHLGDGAPTPSRVREVATADVRRAARLIDSGLRSFASRGARDEGA